MPWNEVTVMQQKRKFIQTYLQQTMSFRKLCSLFEISTKTGYKYVRKYESMGFAGLNEKSRKPKTSPSKTSHEIEQLIINIRNLHPAWAGEKIGRYLQNKGYSELPSEKTINRVLKRNGLILPEESEKHTPWKRFEHENPNDLWQMDFKGHFAMQENGRCHPLTLLDDHSRFSLLIKACENQRGITVQNALTRTFLDYGLPIRMTMDNGSPWGSNYRFRYTALSAWLIRLGIYVTYSRPYHPQTQGKLERFHRTLKTELLNRYSFEGLKQAQEGFDWWRKIYNEERPHAAINHDVPSARYQSSTRIFSDQLPTIEYEKDMIVRKVQKEGWIHYNGKLYKVGVGFHGYPVGLKESLDDGIYEVYFCKQRIGNIDLRFPD